MADDETAGDDIVHDQEQAAGREAGAIGGRAGDEETDPAQRPLQEAGQGEAEGFELAEEDLVENAEHTAGEGAPRLERLGGDEAAPDPATHGEPDTERPGDH
jgi:hypothetical protein